MQTERDTVAIIDDDSDVRASLAALIDSLDMDCQAFASAEEFLDRRLETSPSCVVLDLCLPGLNGLDLLERLAAFSDFPPIIFMTGFATIPLAVKMMRNGAYHVLEKSCRTQELKDSICMAVSRHQLLQKQRQLTQQIKERFNSLSDVEWHVVKGMAEGIPNGQLAEQLSVGLRTVEKRRQQIFRKLDVASLPAFIQLLYRVEPELIRSFSENATPNEDVA